MAHKWPRWLHNPCRLGGPHRYKAGGKIRSGPQGGKVAGKIRSGPQVGKVATLPLLPGGSPPLHSGGQNQKWPTSGQGGYITPAAWGVPTASQRGTKSEVAHKWARWLPRGGRLLAFVRDSPPPVEVGRRPLGGGGGGGGGGALEGGFREGRWGGGSGRGDGGGVQVGQFGVVGGNRLPLPPLALP